VGQDYDFDSYRNRMVTTSEAIQTNVKGSLVIRAPQKQKMETTIEGKKGEDD
jgi:hypothetical protein